MKAIEAVRLLDVRTVVLVQAAERSAAATRQDQQGRHQRQAERGEFQHRRLGPGRHQTEPKRAREHQAATTRATAVALLCPQLLLLAVMVALPYGGLQSRLLRPKLPRPIGRRLPRPHVLLPQLVRPLGSEMAAISLRGSDLSLALALLLLPLLLIVPSAGLRVAAEAGGGGGLLEALVHEE